MHGERVKATTPSALPLAQILAGGVKAQADINSVATRGERLISAMLWNYHDDDVKVAPANVAVKIAGIPPTVKRALVRHYRIDESHSNSYSAWKAMGSPQQPTPEQYAALESAGQLQLLTSPQWMTPQQGAVSLSFTLPRQGVSLVQVTW